jgi:hypothetical protein
VINTHPQLRHQGALNVPNYLLRGQLTRYQNMNRVNGTMLPCRNPCRNNGLQGPDKFFGASYRQD